MSVTISVRRIAVAGARHEEGREVGKSHGRTAHRWRWLLSDATRTI